MRMWVNDGTPTMSLVLYTIDVESVCDASYETWKYRQYRGYHVIFSEKIQNFLQKICRGSDSTVEAPHYLGLCSALIAFVQGDIFIVPHMLWHRASVFAISSKRHNSEAIPDSSRKIQRQYLILPETIQMQYTDSTRYNT